MFYVEDVLNAMESLTKLDFAENPAIIFMAKLRDNLRLRGFSKADADEIVLSMQIEMGAESPFTESQMARLVDTYGQLVSNVQDGLAKHGFSGIEPIKMMASKFSLKLN